MKHTDQDCNRHSSVSTTQDALHSIGPGSTPNTTHTMQALRGAAQPACLLQRSVSVQPFKATPLRATRWVRDSNSQFKAADLCHLLYLQCVSPNLLWSHLNCVLSQISVANLQPPASLTCAVLKRVHCASCCCAGMWCACSHAGPAARASSSRQPQRQQQRHQDQWNTSKTQNSISAKCLSAPS